MAVAAMCVGSIRVASAFSPQPSEVCYDALGNTRYVPAGDHGDVILGDGKKSIPIWEMALTGFLRRPPWAV
jgi:hypothetical protein